MMGRIVGFLVAPPAWWFRLIDALAACLSLVSLLQDGASVLSVVIFASSLLLLATGLSARIYYALFARLRVVALAASLRRP
jgi:hypothetical protein